MTEQDMQVISQALKVIARTAVDSKDVLTQIGDSLAKINVTLERMEKKTEEPPEKYTIK